MRWRPSRGRRRPYLDFVIGDVLPEAGRLAVAADVFLERGTLRPRPGRTLPAGGGRLTAWRCGCTPTSSARRGGIELAIELGARSVDHLEATGPQGAAALARSDVAAVLLPACVVMLDLPRPPARALIEGGAVVALATDFNPGSAYCDSLPLVMSLACMQLGMTPAEALAGCTVNAASVLGRDDRWAGPRPASRATWCCSRPTTGGTRPTIWGRRGARHDRQGVVL